MSNPNDNILAGQVAIVTGGGRGIGRAIAQALAAAGASIAVVARSADQLAETVALIEASGGRALALTADVTDQRAVERMVVETERQLGTVTLLVNNAGSFSTIGPMWEVDADLWWRDLETHLRGAFLCARSVLPSMISYRQGRIITMGSRAGLQPVAYWSTYAIAKSALMRFTENLAIETIDHNISVFTLNPGVVRTAMAEYVLVAGEAWTPWYRRYFDERRDAPPEHIAELCVFLASGEGDTLSGRFVSISDNITEMVQRAEEIKKNNLYTLRLHRL